MDLSPFPPTIPYVGTVDSLRVRVVVWTRVGSEVQDFGETKQEARLCTPGSKYIYGTTDGGLKIEPRFSEGERSHGVRRHLKVYLKVKGSRGPLGTWSSPGPRHLHPFFVSDVVEGRMEVLWGRVLSHRRNSPTLVRLSFPISTSFCCCSLQPSPVTPQFPPVSETRPSRSQFRVGIDDRPWEVGTSRGSTLGSGHSQR